MILKNSQIFAFLPFSTSTLFHGHEKSSTFFNIDMSFSTQFYVIFCKKIAYILTHPLRLTFDASIKTNFK